MNLLKKFSFSLLFATQFLASATAADNAPALAVGITPTVQSVEVLHQGKKVVIRRNQNPKNQVSEIFAKTSRKCPPFCIQPISLAPGIGTIGEVELLDYLKRLSKGDSTILVIDSRTKSWVENGSIPGAINIPWTQLTALEAVGDASIRKVMQQHFNVRFIDKQFDYSKAKTLVLFCNGMWCGQSSRNIGNLVRLGYPVEKLKWYRGGMQDWPILGLTTTADIDKE